MVASSSTTAGGDDKSNGGDFPGTANLLHFHWPERKLYIRLTRPLNQEAERCKVIMAMWMWLEAVGHRGLIRHIGSSPDAALLQFFREAIACMECLLGQRILTLMNSTEIPMTSWLVEEPINLRFFAYHKDLVMNGIVHILDNVCRLIFDDELMNSIAEDARSEKNRQVTSCGFIMFQPHSAGRAQQQGDGEAAPEDSEAPKRKGKEIVEAADSPSPKALPVLGEETAEIDGGAATPAPLADSGDASSTARIPPALQPVEDRCAFITFARGAHMGREDVACFFNGRHAADGQCVERVLIERELPQQPPMFGLIIFTSAAMMESALNGQQSGKYYVNGRFIWARVSKPRPRKPMDEKVHPPAVGAADKMAGDCAV